MRILTLMSVAALGLCAAVPAGSTGPAPVVSSYSWAHTYKVQDTLRERITPPAGFTRTDCARGSYCDWLRNLPLKAEGSPVRYYNGNVKHHAQHHAVIDLDTGDKDLQQCADAVMRLKAEYHYANKDYSKIHFNFTSGHKVSFDDWRRGKKPVVRGNKVSFTSARSEIDNSYRNFRKYMTIIFSYAGSLSLAQELKPVNVSDIKVGDVFIVGGSPGHAVLVIDVAKNDRGQKMFLLAQSYMPAQDMHILQNPFHAGDGPWYSAEIEDILYTPEWHFKPTDLKRFKG